MLRRTLLGSAIAAPFLTACATTGAATGGSRPNPMMRLPYDTSSYARPDEARVRHVSLDLTADFDRKVIFGKATLDVVTRPGAREIVLDSKGLVLKSIRAGGRDAAYTLGPSDDDKGAPLTIQLNNARRIEIEYESAPNADALQWLEPAQTASNKRFLFSQGQAILNRTWIPTQDSPGIRQTYDARIVAPESLHVVMSAEMLTPEGEPAGDGQRAFRFRMPNPIPPYLIALGIGDLVHRDIGPRTGVWAEPSVIERAAYECADMERMVEVTERLYGPYRWGRYDVLILPPSFPYGGMENPRLTFLTPTFLAGDRSLTPLIAHELAHSWSGNLVTNGVWEDSWLNEGFTSYIEGRIGEELFGVDHAHMAEVLAYADIQKTVRDEPANVQRLHLIDDSEQPSPITYDKGALFLRTIEGIVGRDRLDAYLRSYFDRYAFQPMTTQQFLTDFREHVVQGDAALEARLMLDQWAYEPGIPTNVVEPQAQGFIAVTQAVAAFNANGALPTAAWPNWNTMQRQRFIQTLPRQIARRRLDALQRAFELNTIGNMEVRFDWFALAIPNGYQAAGPAIEQFLTEQGRGKFIRPTYTALMRQGAWGQGLARRVYPRARPTYHPIVQAGVDRIMRPATTASAG